MSASRPDQMSSSLLRLRTIKSPRSLPRTSNPRYLKIRMVSLTTPSYLAADRCLAKNGLLSRHEAQKWLSPAPGKNRPQQRQKGESVLFRLSRQSRQTTFSPGLTRKARQISQDEGKRRRAPSFPQAESRVPSDVKSTLLFSADNRCRRASKAARPGVSSRSPWRTSDRSRIP